MLIIVQFLVDNKTKEVMEEKRYFNGFKILLDSKIRDKSNEEMLEEMISHIQIDEISNDIELVYNYLKDTIA